MSISVVGAGIGGMISALLLSNKGYEVTIYEKNHYLGGRLTYETDGEYTIEQGPTIVLLPELLLEILEEAGIARDQLELIPCEPLYDLFFADGTKMTKWRDPDKQEEALEQAYPGTGEAFRRYLIDMETIYHFGYDAFLSRSFHRMRDFLTLENMKFIMKSQSYQSLSTFLSRYFKNEKVKQAYMLQSLYIGGSPYRVPALYGLISYSEHAFGIWYLKGGYHSLIPLLEQALVDRGVQIQTGTNVERIVVEDDRVSGVQVNGETHAYDQVIFNGEYPHLNQLLDSKSTQSKRDYQPSSGCLLVYLGVNKRYPEREAHQFFLPNEFEKHMKEVFETKSLSNRFSTYVFNPVALDHEAAPPNKSVLYFLIPVPSNNEIDWEAAKHHVVEQAILQVEALGFPGLSEAIEWKKIRTPQDAEISGLFQGGSFGIAPHLQQSGAFRPQVMHSKIHGLFTVGASVHPGGGIPIVMQGARLLDNHFEEKKEMIK
ncbi:phytoene desaturase family protein [Alkalibacillus almallahensis]|uniref:phytoene desaturase family protein n=1 Tax=Alkalibacillus almallahensis TaxID=1379154 RepID=UPI00141E8B37|nr:phytoene desaturase family protein [Alkalibacillus almallahensis]NIK11391.1 phytoene desaturase [Alkalibacillus almallahensis]